MDDQNIFRRIDPANRPIQLIMGLCLLAYAFSGPFLPTQGVAWAVINLLEAVCIYSAVNLYRKMYGRLSPWLYVGIAAAIWCGLMLCAFRGWAPAAEPFALGLGLAQICVFLFAEHRESRADPENKAIQLAAAVCLLSCAPLAPHVYQAGWREINWPFVVLVIGLIRFFYKPYSRLSPVFYGGVLVAVLALISVSAYFQWPLLRTVDLMTLGLGLAQLGVFLFSRRKREAV